MYWKIKIFTDNLRKLDIVIVGKSNILFSFKLLQIIYKKNVKNNE